LHTEEGSVLLTPDDEQQADAPHDDDGDFFLVV